nr:hypothetical protein [Mucilaginibacter sp. L294]
MLNYLYYKLYKAAGQTSSWSIAGFSASLLSCFLIGINLVTISLFLSKTYNAPFLASGNYIKALVAIASALIFVFYYDKKRQKTILAKYAKESNKRRVFGNIALAFYFLLSYLVLLMAATFASHKG